MKTHLPPNHGLSPQLLESPLVHRTGGEPSLTDAQYDGLAAGAATGESLLVVAPTSSGKTQIGLLAAASWITGRDALVRRAVYLVSHRALARQKFNELARPEYLRAFGLEPSEIAMSNGDMSVDGNANPADDPLDARLLIATYEKFLALLAGSGLRQDMTHYCVVADEFQLIADPNRGQDIEILFTIIRMARYGQFIGLSAVLDSTDLRTLAEWIGAKQLIVHTREVPLAFEMRTPSAIHHWRTDGPDEVTTGPASPALDVVRVLTELEANRERHFPVAVFCMTKGRVEELARDWAGVRGVSQGSARLQASLFEEPTALSEALAVYMPQGFGIHTADLIEGERTLVEQALDRDELAVVFATTTLAQGLNYSFKTVVFDSWKRWNSARRQAEPISNSDFHNIAGRAGRLGRMAGQHGKVIYFATERREEAVGGHYLDTEMHSQIHGQIDPRRLDQLVLQILSSGLIKDRDALFRFIGSTLSIHVAEKAGSFQREVWEARLDDALATLEAWGFIR